MSRRERLEKLLAAQPDDVFLNFGLAMELGKEGDRDRAITQFDHVLRLDPNYHPAHYHKAVTLIELGRTDEARKVLTAGLDAARVAADTHAESEMADLLASLD